MKTYYFYKPGIIYLLLFLTGFCYPQKNYKITEFGAGEGISELISYDNAKRASSVIADNSLLLLLNGCKIIEKDGFFSIKATGNVLNPYTIEYTKISPVLAECSFTVDNFTMPADAYVLKFTVKYTDNLNLKSLSSVSDYISFIDQEVLINLKKDLIKRNIFNNELILNHLYINKKFGKKTVPVYIEYK